MNYQEALKKGLVLILQVLGQRPNGQVGVQFIQKVENPSSGNSSEIISVLQGDNANSNYDGMTTLTTWGSAHISAIEKAGLKLNHNYKNNDEIIFADKAFGLAEGTFQIACVENTVKNPVSTKQMPKVPGANSTEVICLGDLPVYRHTAPVAGKPNSLSVQSMTPDEQCTELNGRFFLTNAVTNRKQQSEFPEIFTNARIPVTASADDNDVF